MNAKHIAEHESSETQSSLAGADVRNGIGESRSVWLTAREAARYVGCRSVRAFYMWRNRKGLVSNGRGLYARRDLDKAMAIPRKRHAMSTVSLSNLRRRHAQQSTNAQPFATVPKG